MPHMGMTLEQDGETQIQVHIDGDFIHLGDESSWVLSISCQDWKSLVEEVELGIKAQEDSERE